MSHHHAHRHAPKIEPPSHATDFDLIIVGGGLTGSALADRLTGCTLSYIIAGGAGYDTIYGGVGNDTLGGGTGADSMTGGAGVDRLTGGGDADRFVYSATSQSTNAAFDTITDFSQAQGDKIDLHLVDARTTLAGVQHFGFAAGATAYSVWAVQDVINNVTHLYGDTNGNAATAEFRVDISGLHTLVAGDLVLV